MLKLGLSIIGMMRYSLAVNSRVSLANSASLSQPAYLLGKEVASKGHTLLSPIGLSLNHRVAAGVSDKAGLSIGFSPAASFRYHVTELQLPTDVYDWLYFSNLKNSSLLTALIQSSQALLLVGGVMANITELAIASDALLPVGILLDEANQANNDLLKYLQSLPIEKQRHIVVHKDPKILLSTILRMLKEIYKDVRPKDIEKNDQLFSRLIKDSTKNKD